MWVERGFNCVRREPWVNYYTGFYRTFHEAQEAGKSHLLNEVDALTDQLVKKTNRLAALTNLEEKHVREPSVFEKMDFSNLKILGGFIE